MKKLIFIFLILIIISLPHTTFSEENGRYQLFQGELKHYYMKGEKIMEYSQKELFKIDTKTGDVWMAKEYFNQITPEEAQKLGIYPKNKKIIYTIERVWKKYERIVNELIPIRD